MFLRIVILVSLLMNGYVVLRLAGLLAIKKTVWLFLLIIFLSLSFIAANIFNRSYPGMLSRILYRITAAWVGISFLFFFTLLAYELVRFFISHSPRTAGCAIISFVSVLSAYSVINASIIRVKEYSIEAPVKMKIVHLSDIHLGSVSASKFEKIIERTNSLKPDVVFITGDLFDNASPYNQQAVLSLNKLNAPVFFSTGNHERYVGIAQVEKLLSQTKVKFLRDQSTDFGDIQIIGINDKTHEKQMLDALDEITVEPQKYSILMYHRPEGLKEASQKGIKLFLAGHVHDGQIFPFNFFVRIFFKYLSGLHYEGGTCLAVTSGTGFWGPPMRLGSHCQIVVLNLSPPDSSL